MERCGRRRGGMGRPRQGRAGRPIRRARRRRMTQSGCLGGARLVLGEENCDQTVWVLHHFDDSYQGKYAEVTRGAKKLRSSLSVSMRSKSSPLTRTSLAARPIRSLNRTDHSSRVEGAVLAPRPGGTSRRRARRTHSERHSCAAACEQHRATRQRRGGVAPVRGKEATTWSIASGVEN